MSLLQRMGIRRRIGLGRIGRDVRDANWGAVMMYGVDCVEMIVMTSAYYASLSIHGL